MRIDIYKNNRIWEIIGDKNQWNYWSVKAIEAWRRHKIIDEPCKKIFFLNNFFSKFQASKIAQNLRQWIRKCASGKLEKILEMHQSTKLTPMAPELRQQKFKFFFF